MWRNEDLFGVLADSVLPARRRSRARHDAPRSGAIAKAHRRRGREPRAPPGVAAHARHRRRSRRSRRCSSARRSSRSSAGTSTRTSCGRPCSASASRRWRSSATRSPSRWCARSKRPRRRATPYDISSLQLIISSGVMWSAEIKQALMAARQLHLLRLARLERGRRLRGLDQRARLRARRPRSSRSARARRCSPTTGARSCPAPARSACSRSAATSRVGYYKDERKSDATFRDDRRRALVGAGRLRERRGRRHDRAARPRLGRASTRAARRSSPKRSRKR